MTDTPRRRGRPKGATRYAEPDRLTLDSIADLVAATPGLTPTTAMRRLGIHDPSHHRRLQRKWGRAAAQLEQAAHARRRPTPRPAASMRGMPPIGSHAWFQDFLQQQERLRGYIDSPAERAACQALEHAKALRATIDPLALQTIQASLKEAERIRDILNPPHTQVHLQALRLFR